MKTVAIFDHGFRLYADSAAHRTNQPVFLPGNPDDWTALICPAVKISRLGTHISPKFAQRYYDSVAAACLFVPSDKTEDPYRLDERYFAMDSAFATGLWTPIENHAAQMALSCGNESSNFTLDSLGVDTAISEMSQFMTLKMGDIFLFAAQPLGIKLKAEYRLLADIDGHTPGIDIKIK